MAKYRGLQIEHDGDTLTVRAKNSATQMARRTVSWRWIKLRRVRRFPPADGSHVSDLECPVVRGALSRLRGVFRSCRMSTPPFSIRDPAKSSTAPASAIAPLKRITIVSRKSQASP